MVPLAEQMKVVLAKLLGQKPKRVRQPRGFVPTQHIASMATHRVPPRVRRVRSAGGRMITTVTPASTKVVPIYGMAWVPSGKDYRGLLGAKDRSRRAAATGRE